MPRAAPRSVISFRSRRLQATPPATRTVARDRSCAPSAASPRPARRRPRSRTTRRRRPVGDSRPEAASGKASCPRTWYRTAVLTPLNENPGRSPSGRTAGTGSRPIPALRELRDRRSSGYPSPSRCATLSNASPAASSSVAPREYDLELALRAVESPSDRRRRRARGTGRGALRPLLHRRRVDVRFDVVHADERQSAVHASAFAADTPTRSDPIRPGRVVTAIASMRRGRVRACSSAASITGQDLLEVRASRDLRARRRRATACRPPGCGRPRKGFRARPRTTRRAVSSQEDSMPRMRVDTSFSGPIRAVPCPSRRTRGRGRTRRSTR
jgi:hypothetical protein